MEIKIMYTLLYTNRKNSGSRISEDESTPKTQFLKFAKMNNSEF